MSAICPHSPTSISTRSSQNSYISTRGLQIVPCGILLTNGYINPSRLAAFAFPITFENYDIQKTTFRIYGLRSLRSEIN